MLLNNTETLFFGFFACSREIHNGVIVFRCKDRFAGFDKWQHLFMPAIEEIIFCDCKIEMVDQISNLVSSIFDSDRESALMCLFCQP